MYNVIHRFLGVAVLAAMPLAMAQGAQAAADLKPAINSASPDPAAPAAATVRVALQDDASKKARRAIPGRPAAGRGTPARAKPGAQPDLVVRHLSVTPSSVAPGAELTVHAMIRNDGNAVAPGNTAGKGFVVDITLGTDGNTPAGFANYSPNYKEDVLLKGGRFSNTTDLAPGEMKNYSDTNNQIPADTPPGKYYVCARVDPGNAVAEKSEGNNTACIPITVKKTVIAIPGRIARGPAAAKICPGLPAPRQRAPRSGSKFSNVPRTTRFSWAAVKDAQSYGIEVDCMHCCTQGKWCSEVGKSWHVKDGLTATQHVHNFVGAQPGRWRVWAVDACGRKGKVSGWWNFEYTR